MLNSFFSKIKNGSDIRGIASKDNIELTNEVVEKIAKSFVLWIANTYKLEFKDITVAIGHDSRISAQRLKNVFINTIRDMGVNVYDCFLATTPAMFMAVSILKCTACVQITASHLPGEKNGFKFFTSKGCLNSDDIEEILSVAQDQKLHFVSSKQGSVREINIMKHYSEKLIKLIKENSDSNNDKPLKNLKIIVDAGNGAGGFFAKDVLEVLGADISASIGLEPDGTFPIHIPNPENKEVLKTICKLTKENNADMGIVFDTDVDRVAIVDSFGNLLSGTKLIALVSYFILKQHPKSVIVTDSMTYDSLRKFIESNSGLQFRYKRGYSNVINMAKRINEKGGNCQVAIETSGHCAFKENNFMDDGAYLACKIIIEALKIKNMSKTFNDLISGLEMPIEELNFRLNLKFDADINKVIKDLKSYAKSSKIVKFDEENVDGVRIIFSERHQRGVLLIRESLHEPKLIVYMESYSFGGIKAIHSFAKSFLKKYDFIDISNL